MMYLVLTQAAGAAWFLLIFPHGNGKWPILAHFQGASGCDKRQIANFSPIGGA